MIRLYFCLLGTVNLKYGVHKAETPVTCTAGVGTFILEFGALSRLTGKIEGSFNNFGVFYRQTDL